MTECDEVAANMQLPQLMTYDEVCAWVREQMPDESYTVQENVAWSLFRRKEAHERV